MDTRVRLKEGGQDAEEGGRGLVLLVLGVEVEENVHPCCKSLF